jgi:hypothetical protein
MSVHDPGSCTPESRQKAKMAREPRNPGRSQKEKELEFILEFFLGSRVLSQICLLGS